ncbi:hypothetical protein A6770_14900 [Nostoc minutum NIES-26]|uniref:Uncharacterized protein n=1 Tax=Nostoc minutum NIES-26 TaxID=1844469 RepID=A0A367RKB6_9NOSO|nr:hypothetical protein A6770_14900 [Nostoc minutum NIES-26]
MSFTKKHDPKSSRFSYLRHFAKEKFQETCTVAIGYSEDLSEATDQEIKIFLTSKEQKSNKHFAARVFSYVSHSRQNKTVFGSKVGIKSHFQLMFLMLNGSLCLSIVLAFFSAAPSYAKDWYVSPMLISI